MIEAFETGWEQIFGLPAEIRHDPEGGFVSNELLTHFSERGVQLKPVAGEAHWQNGLCERAIQSIFNSAVRISSEQHLPISSGISLAVAAHNHLTVIHGFSPAQWALGQQPNWYWLLHEENEDVNLARDGHEAFAKKMLSQINAKRVWQEEELKLKIQRAERAKHRKDMVFMPGEIVFAWRLGHHKTPGTKKTGLHKGAWFGPATVLGTESRIEDNRVVPGNIVWVIVSDRLWRCAPQQLRRASEREAATHLLTQAKPWTFENITRTLVIGDFRDIVNDVVPDVGDEPVQEDIREESDRRH